MRRFFTLFCAFVLCLTFFTGCDKGNENNGTLENPIASYDEESVFFPEGESSGSVVIKEKKYSYEDKNIVILDAQNKTLENYIITIKGSYLDGNNNILETETQTFDQFATETQQFFIFHSDIDFQNFTYTFEVQKTDATMYINNIEFVFNGLEEAFWPVDELVDNGDHTFHPVIQSMFGYKNNSEDDSLGLVVSGIVILINENDEIISMYDMTSSVYNSEEVDFNTKQIYYSLEDELVWPDAYKGQIRALHATTQCIKVEK